MLIPIHKVINPLKLFKLISFPLKLSKLLTPINYIHHHFREIYLILSLIHKVINQLKLSISIRGKSTQMETI